MSDLARELEALRTEVRELRAQVDAPRRRRTRLFVAAALLTASVAFAQLVTFSADQPAIASEVNGNFTQLRTWLETKVGSVSQAFITTPSVVLSPAAGSVTITSTAAGQLSTSGGLFLADNTGIQSTRFGVTAAVVNQNTNNFSGGFLEGTFTDAGGTIVIMASATGWCGSTGRITMNVRVDGTIVGAMRVTCNVVNSHMAFPPAFIRLNRGILSNGTFNPPVTRTVRLEPINCSSGCAAGLVTTNADSNDFGEVTVLRLPTP